MVIDSEFVDRSAVVLLPKKPMLDWINQHGEPGGELSLKQVRQDPTVYLVPSVEDSGDQQQVLLYLWRDLFERELLEWITEPKRWPKSRDLETFNRWFEISWRSSVVDLGQ